MVCCQFLHQIKNFKILFRYKDNSPEVAETARALATAYSNVGEEDAESKCNTEIALHKMK